METVAGKAERSHNALLIIDVQVGLVKLISAEIRAGVISRIETLLSRAALPGHP
jgi:nicotinamidase-related amidase